MFEDIDFLTVTICTIIGWLVGYFTARGESKAPKHPYSWSCPMNDCGFEITSSHKDTMTYIATGHMKYERSK